MKEQIEEKNTEMGNVITRTEEFIQKNQKIIIGVVVGILLVALAIFGYYKWYKQPREQRASAELFAAEQYFLNGEYQKALDGDDNHRGLLAVIDSYGSTKAGNLAKYYAGVANLQLGNYAEADKWLGKYSGKDLFTKAIALMGQADAAMEQGNTADAANKNSTANKDGKLNKQAENLSILWAYEKTYISENKLPTDATSRIDNFIRFYITNKNNSINFTQYTKLLMNIIDYEEDKKLLMMKKIDDEKKNVIETLKDDYAHATKQKRKQILDEYESESAYFEQLQLEYEDDDTNELINHYYALLESNNLTDDDRNAYLDKIDELERKKEQEKIA